MKVYHIAYDPAFKSVNIHFWTACNLACRSCYTNYQTLDFGLLDDPVATIAASPRASPPNIFLSIQGVMQRLKTLEVSVVIFMGTEAALDPELPALAQALHHKFHCYNILLTNGCRLTDMKHVDEVVVSLKAVTERVHHAYTGKSNDRILDNFKTLHSQGKKLQAETVLIPGLIDEIEIERVAKFIAGVDKNIPLRVDAYFPVGNNPWQAASPEQVQAAATRAKNHLSKVNSLTLDMKRVGSGSVRIF